MCAFPLAVRAGVAALALASSLAAAAAPSGLLPGGGPLPLAYWQSLFAGYTEDRVGSAVSLSGDLLAVGVPSADSGASFDTGRVDVYRWFDAIAGWTRITSFTTQTFGITPVANGRFGAAVALSGEWLLVGCPGCDPADDAKAILVRIPDTIELTGEARGTLEWRRVTPPGLEGYGDPIEGTGSAVALSVVRNGPAPMPGSSIVFAVGSPKAQAFLIDSHEQADGAALTEVGAIAMGRYEIGSPDVVWESGPTYGTTPYGLYGRSLGLAAATWTNLGLYLNQRYLVVGEPGWVAQGGFGVSGRAHLWQRDGSMWNAQQSFTVAAPGFVDALGMAVAVERAGNDSLGTIALGAPGRSVDGTPGGSVLVWRQQAVDGPYVFDQEIQHPAAMSADRLGGALALSGGKLLVGADGRAVDLSNNAGAAYVYRREFNLVLGDFSWRLKQTLTEPAETGGSSAFGASVAIGPRAAAIGAPTSDAAGLVNAGRVATYLCDRIFSDSVDGQPPNGCGRP
jgi:hypothetical protein